MAAAKSRPRFSFRMLAKHHRQPGRDFYPDHPGSIAVFCVARGEEVLAYYLERNLAFAYASTFNAIRPDDWVPARVYELNAALTMVRTAVRETAG